MANQPTEVLLRIEQQLKNLNRNLGGAMTALSRGRVTIKPEDQETVWTDQDGNKLPDQDDWDDSPRAHTADECRERLLRHLDGLVRYMLNESRQPTAAHKLDLLVFSILSMIDGCSGEMPAFRLTPSPHPDDQQYWEDHGENWWPEDLSNLSDGELHSRWAQRKKNWLPKETA